MAKIKVGLRGQMFPPAEHAVASIKRAEELGWDFINYPDQLTGTHPFGMLRSPVTDADPSYHFLFHLRDGEIVRVREYLCTKLVEDTFAPLMATAAEGG